MLQDKRDDLEVEKQKKFLLQLVNELTVTRPDLYYQSTAEISRHIHEFVSAKKGMNSVQLEVLGPLSQREIEVLLSHN